MIVVALALACAGEGPEPADEAGAEADTARELADEVAGAEGDLAATWTLRVGERDPLQGYEGSLAADDSLVGLHLVNDEGANLHLVLDRIADTTDTTERTAKRGLIAVGDFMCRFGEHVRGDDVVIVRFEDRATGTVGGTFEGIMWCLGDAPARRLPVEGRFQVADFTS